MSFTMGVYGRPETGKTTFMLQLAEKLAADGKVLFVSFDAFRNTLEGRCRVMGVCTDNIDFRDDLFSIDEVRDYVRNDEGISALFLDYIQMLGTHDDNVKRLGDIGIPVIFASLLGRQVDLRPGHRAVLKDIDIVDKRHGKADISITLWRPQETMGLMPAEIEVMRGRELDGLRVGGYMDMDRVRFEFGEEAWDSILRIMSL